MWGNGAAGKLRCMLTSDITLPVLAGDVVAPADAEWDLARRAWNLAADQRPALVAFPADAADVVALVAFAREYGFRLAPQGTGHNASALGSLEDAILVSTQRMRGVEIDAAAQVARVAAGTLWLEVTEAATPFGLYPLSGSSPDVGVVGYTLGGGLSWLARKHGLAADSVVAVEVVTPAGELVRATATDHAELFWALRGGGGSFGIVTALEFRLYPYEHVYAGMLLWPYEARDAVLRAWRETTLGAPDELTTAVRIMHFPPLPELPPFLSGRSVVIVDGAFAGDADAGAAALAGLRALEPELDTFAPASPLVLSRIHMDPEEPIPYASRTALLSRLDDAALDAFAGGIQPGSPVMFGELRHLGGAVGRVPQGAGALGSLDGEYLMFAGGMVMAPEAAPAVAAALGGFRAALAPWATGRDYGNFVEQPADAARFYGEDAYARLRAIRAAVDPGGLMLANHPVG